MGGPGSGNFGHAGQGTGEVGGSGPGGGKESSKGFNSWKHTPAPRIVYQHSESTINIPDHEEVCKYDLEYPLPLNLKGVAEGLVKEGYVKPSDDAHNPRTEEAQAMGKWKGQGYEMISAYNSHPETMGDDERAEAERITQVMDNVLSKSEIEQDVTVYRGINWHTADNIDTKGEYTNPNFTSTTLAPGTAMGFTSGVPYMQEDGSYKPGRDIQTLMMFTVPKGSKGFYWDSENEVLLPRGLSLKCTGVTEFQKGITMKAITKAGRMRSADYTVPIKVYTMEMKK